MRAIVNQRRLMEEVASVLRFKGMHRNWICNDKQRKKQKKRGGEASDGTRRKYIQRIQLKYSLSIGSD